MPSLECRFKNENKRVTAFIVARYILQIIIYSIYIYIYIYKVVSMTVFQGKTGKGIL